LVSWRLSLIVQSIPDNIPQSKLYSVFSYVAPFATGFIGWFTTVFDPSDKVGGILIVGMAADGSWVHNLSIEDFLATNDSVVNSWTDKPQIYCQYCKN
jgi:hypothetical protein